MGGWQLWKRRFEERASHAESVEVCRGKIKPNLETHPGAQWEKMPPCRSARATCSKYGSYSVKSWICMQCITSHARSFHTLVTLFKLFYSWQCMHHAYCLWMSTGCMPDEGILACRDINQQICHYTFPQMHWMNFCSDVTKLSDITESEAHHLKGYFTTTR